MDERIALTTAARLCGDSPGTFRAVLSDYLPKFGVKEGKERRVNVWEVVALRTLTELSSSKLSLKQAAQRVSGLLPFLRQMVEGKLGGEEKGYVFAVEVWGFINGGYSREGFIVEGSKELARCVAEAADLGWPNCRVVNLSQVLAEVAHGWSIAVDGPELARALMEDKLRGRTEGEQELARSIFNEMAARLDPLGERRPEPPARTNWQMRTPKEAASAARQVAA